MKAIEFDEKFDNGEDISAYVDWSKARRPNQEVRPAKEEFDGVDRAVAEQQAICGAIRANKEVRMQYISIVISVLALAVSGFTLWLSHFRRGKLKMTKPTVIFFGPDGGERGISKLFLRTLLYSTAKRGVVLEHLYVRLRRGETQ